MAQLEPLISLHELKTGFLSEVIAHKRERQLYFSYDDQLDVLKAILLPKGEEYAVYFVDEYLALLYQPDTLEIIGLMVEDFESGFLEKYPKIQQLWEQTRTILDQTIREVAHITEELIGDPGIELAAALT